MLLVDDWVVQPALNVSRGGFTANVWGNYEPTDETGHQNKFTEIDLTAEYAFELDKFTIQTGVIHYAFPNTEAPDTTEIYAGLGYDWIVSPQLTVYYDMDEAHGFYVNLGAGYSLELPPESDAASVSLELAAGVGYSTSDYNRFYYGVDESAWSDWSVSLGLPVSLFKGVFTITPSATYTALIDNKLKDTTEKDGNFYFGLLFSLAF
jgi:hypothetical protein